MKRAGRSGVIKIMSVATTLTFCLSAAFANPGDEANGFRGWVLTYCDGNQPIEPAIVDYASCSTEDAFYQVAAPGVRYKSLRQGTGRAARDGDVVVVEYLGWVYDKESAYARGAIVATSYTFENQSFEFTLGDEKVISGWEHGIRGMQRGEVRELIIAPDMAYGDRELGDRIPPGSTLVFEIELLGFKLVE